MRLTDCIRFNDTGRYTICSSQVTLRSLTRLSTVRADSPGVFPEQDLPDYRNLLDPYPKREAIGMIGASLVFLEAGV